MSVEIKDDSTRTFDTNCHKSICIRFFQTMVERKTHYMDGLNESQRDVVCHGLLKNNTVYTKETSL